ncbi:hypothetical protein GCM10027051_14430 [Niabella terrae]
MNDAVNATTMSAGQFSIDWDDIYYDIKTQKAILVLGPGFLAQGEKSARELLYEDLCHKPDNGVLHFNTDYEIFLFESQFHKTKAQKYASLFYEKIKPDPDILKCISELPFPLIINTNPDTALLGAYKESSKKLQFDYFTGRASKVPAEIARPDKDTPLVYNLFGAAAPESLESVIMDFEDMFAHLKALFENSRQVPDAFNTILKEADTYIFVGFSIEKLRTQLLMRYINNKTHDFDNRDKNYTTRATGIDKDSESFFTQQFNIKYYGTPVEFLNEIHRLYFESKTVDDTAGILIKPFKELAKNYISLNELDKAFEILKSNVFDGDQKNELILYQLQYASYCEKQAAGTEYKMNLDVELNKLAKSLLDFIDRLTLDNG